MSLLERSELFDQLSKQEDFVPLVIDLVRCWRFTAAGVAVELARSPRHRWRHQFSSARIADRPLRSVAVGD